MVAKLDSTAQPARRILTINTGSSSLKVAVYETAPETRVLSASIDRIGGSGGRIRLTGDKGQTLVDQSRDFGDHGAALQAIEAWLHDHHADLQIDAIGHRLVHGGIRYREPQRITPEMLDGLRGLIALAPNHLPQAIRTIEVAIGDYPGIPQIACFDTAFHRHMPRTAQIYPLPRRLADEGIVRYGFHGLSYEYVVGELRRIAPEEAAGRVIIAHLGNGASMAAVRGGIGIDTTMGFTPLGGLMMGTRPGDLDPGVLLYLAIERKIAPEALSEMIVGKSGLAGVSQTSADMRDLLEKESSDPRAAEAVALFCYQARKHLGALTAVLGGLDALVFTGGIGEHAAPIRQRICEGLAFLGIDLDPDRNAASAQVISRSGRSPNGKSVAVRVIKTDEDLMIARHTRRLTGPLEVDSKSIH